MLTTNTTNDIGETYRIVDSASTKKQLQTPVIGFGNDENDDEDFALNTKVLQVTSPPVIKTADHSQPATTVHSTYTNTSPTTTNNPKLKSESTTSVKSINTNNRTNEDIKQSSSDLRGGSTSATRYKNNILNYYFNDKMYMIDENNNNNNHYDTKPISSSSYPNLTANNKQFTTSSTKTLDDDLNSNLKSNTFLDDEEPIPEDDFLNELRKSSNVSLRPSVNGSMTSLKNWQK